MSDQSNGNPKSSFGTPPVINPPPQSPVFVQHNSQGDGTGGIIPYKNVPALLAYYFAVFSIVPIFGLILAPVALTLGILGLRKKKQHPETKGTVHAWIGIVVGGLVMAAYATGVIVLLVAAAN